MTIIDSETEENHETIAIATVGEANETSERVDENQAQMIATDESDSAYGNNNENNYGNSSVVSPVERSPLELATGGEPEHIEERKSDICCVCCFDHRRACKLVNIIFIFLNVIGILASIAGFSTANAVDFSQLDDDEIVQEIEQEIENLREEFTSTFWILVCQEVIGIIFAVMGIVGAQNYDQRLILATGIYYVLDLIAFALFGSLVGVIIRSVFSYPHFGLYRAIKKGFMTPATYEREQYFCCNPEHRNRNRRSASSRTY